MITCCTGQYSVYDNEDGARQKAVGSYLGELHKLAMVSLRFISFSYQLKYWMPSHSIWRVKREHMNHQYCLLCSWWITTALYKKPIPGEWMGEWVSEWVCKWVDEWVSKCVSGWTSECVSECVSERVCKWVDEWVREWVCEWASV